MVDKKISMYSNLKGKLDIYKKHIKEEDEMRKNNPQLFVDTAEIQFFFFEFYNFIFLD